jgi:hypothetical protein
MHARTRRRPLLPLLAFYGSPVSCEGPAAVPAARTFFAPPKALSHHSLQD